MGLKKRTKTNKGRGSQVYLYFRSVKKLPDFSKRKQSSGGGQLLKLLLFEPSPAYKGVFFIRRRHILFLNIFLSYLFSFFYY